MNKNTPGRRPPPLWYLLLVAPFIAMFRVSSYNSLDPAWAVFLSSIGISCCGSRAAQGVEGEPRNPRKLVECDEPGGGTRSLAQRHRAVDRNDG